MTPTTCTPKTVKRLSTPPSSLLQLRIWLSFIGQSYSTSQIIRRGGWVGDMNLASFSHCYCFSACMTHVRIYSVRHVASYVIIQTGLHGYPINRAVRHRRCDCEIATYLHPLADKRMPDTVIMNERCIWIYHVLWRTLRRVNLLPAGVGPVISISQSPESLQFLILTITSTHAQPHGC